MTFKARFLAVATGIALVAGCQMPETTQTAEFMDIAGAYSGEFVPNSGNAKDIAIEIAPDGSYNWVMEGEFLTDGQLTRRSDGGLQYENEIGSRGLVTAAGDSLTWANVFTGNNYQVAVTR